MLGVIVGEKRDPVGHQVSREDGVSSIREVQ